MEEIIRNRLHLSPRGWELVSAYGQIAAGCLIGAAAYPAFLTPNAIAPGGLTGVAIILNRLFSLPIGAVSFALNIPLFLIGWRAMGHIFVFRSLIATILFSLLIDILPIAPLTADPLLATLYGGLLLGIGLGLILRGNATTGGSDMVARMVHRRFQFISVGAFLFMVDFCVVIAAGLLLSMEEALYALICIYLSGKVVDVVMLGGIANKACFIITPSWKNVSDRLMREIGRGVTQLTARGGWSGSSKPVVLCVTSRQEIPHVKQIVREEDKHAFMFITEAREALGEGFSDLNREG